MGDSPLEGEDPDMSFMEALEDAEKRTLHLASEEYYMPMTTCEESVDISYFKVGRAADISDAIACADVGEVRHLLDRQLGQCLLSELCEDESPGTPTGLLPGRVPQGRNLEHRSLTTGDRWA